VFFLNSLTKISKFTELLLLKVGKKLIFIGFTVVSSKNTFLLADLWWCAGHYHLEKTFVAWTRSIIKNFLRI
jgi:hypothetical protein